MMRETKNVEKRMIKINKHLLALVIGTAILLPNTTDAQEKLTLNDAIQIALKNNFDIKLIENGAQIAKNNNNLGNAGILPIAAATFNTAGSRQNTVQTQSSGTERKINGARNSNMGYGVGLDWTIFDGFAMFANYEKLKALEAQSKQTVTSQIYASVADVITVYYSLVNQQKLIRAADSTMEISRLRLEIAANKLAIGRGSKLDLLAAQVDFNTDTSTYLQNINIANNYMVQLNQLLARNVDEKFTIDENLTIGTDLNYEDLATSLTQLNPILQSAMMDKKIAELNQKQIKGSRYPQISLSSGYDFNRSESPTGFNTKFRSNGLSYGLTASVNLFNGFLQRQNERNATVSVDNASIQLQKTKEGLLAQLKSAYLDYTTFKQLIGLETRNIQIANENLNITLEKYRLGNISALELREAQKNAIAVNNRYIQTIFTTKTAEIQLKQLSGTLNLQ